MTHPSQEQFLEVIDRDTAERRFQSALRLGPLGEELIPLGDVLGRTLSRDVHAAVDVPSFDRSNVDGFAVQASDTFGAREDQPRRLKLLSEVLATGAIPATELICGTAVTIATGGMLPRGADAVVMVEHVDVEGDELVVRRAVTPGAGISFTGTDMTAGETVLRRGERLTSRETGVLAAIGQAHVPVWRKPRVAVFSTGDELIAPGEPMRPALVYDSNGRILADAVRELGGTPESFGIVGDDEQALRTGVQRALATCDIVLLSGGTSKGAGDLSYRVLRELHDPGILVHGVALKPGKPICLAASQGKPLVILPGFPTSAVFTFHEFVAPIVRSLAGLPPARQDMVPARLAVKVNSEIGRTEYLLVGLVEREEEPEPGEQPRPSLVAYPMGKGSGSVTAFSRADGFVVIGRHEEILEAGAPVAVQRLGRDTQVADLVIIGSHCVGLDLLLGRMQERGYRSKFLAVGSQAGLEAARRGECDLAGIHLLDPATGEYNRPFATGELEFLAGYGRPQGILYRPGDARFEGKTAREAIAAVLELANCRMVNRNPGSGTRVLIEELLGGKRPAGFAIQPRSHNAVAAAVLQGRADWGVAIRSVADQAGLGFLPLTTEQFDFVAPRARWERPAVQTFREIIADPHVRQQLAAIGLVTD